MRAVADFDPARYDALLEMPVAELLLAFEDKLRRRAAEDYRIQVLTWAALAGGGRSKNRKPPKPPDILQS